MVVPRLGNGNAQVGIGRAPVTRNLRPGNRPFRIVDPLLRFQLTDEVDADPAAAVVLVQLIGMGVVELRKVHLLGHFKLLQVGACEKTQEEQILNIEVPGQ